MRRFLFATFTLVAAVIFFVPPAQAEPPPQTIAIPLNPPLPLNGRKKQDIYDLRLLLAAKYPQLTGGGAYKPSDEIFGQITDGKPWWGLMGRSYYGPGENAIRGDAEESRFIANPLLFFGLDSGHAIVGSGPKPIAVYPIPSNLLWQADGKLGMVDYAVGSFMRSSTMIGDDTAGSGHLEFVAYNARDFGYNYFAVDPTRSKGISAHSRVGRIMQFIHTGGSCGYPGGCNNMSPDQPEMKLDVTGLPAVACIKLWKAAPSGPEAPADAVFLIRMK
jgi:hypothetical protein